MLLQGGHLNVSILFYVFFFFLFKKTTLDSIHMERISSPLAEFVKVLCTNRVLITVRAVPTKRVSFFQYWFSVHIRPTLGTDLDNTGKE